MGGENPMYMGSESGLPTSGFGQMVIVIYSDEGGTHSTHELLKVAFYIRSNGLSYSTANEVVSLNVRGTLINIGLTEWFSSSSPEVLETGIPMVYLPVHSEIYQGTAAPI